jgi:Ni,Fe-hydrogenase III small subunit
MLAWILRGLHKGVVTSRYPRKPEPELEGLRTRIELIDPEGASDRLEAVCPTGAIRVESARVALDRARCILCGRCVEADPERFRFSSAYETAIRSMERQALGDVARPLRRSIHIRHVDAGSDGAEEWEISALTNPYYDMQRLGLYFTLSPRHADILLVTGGVTPSMEEPLRRAFEVMPGPKAVVAAGTDACSGGFAAGAGEVAGGVERVLPVDVHVPGSPPTPIALLHGLLLAAGIVTEAAT